MMYEKTTMAPELEVRPEKKKRKQQQADKEDPVRCAPAPQSRHHGGVTTGWVMDKGQIMREIDQSLKEGDVYVIRDLELPSGSSPAELGVIRRAVYQFQLPFRRAQILVQGVRLMQQTGHILELARVDPTAEQREKGEEEKAAHCHPPPYSRSHPLCPRPRKDDALKSDEDDDEDDEDDDEDIDAKYEKEVFGN